MDKFEMAERKNARLKKLTKDVVSQMLDTNRGSFKKTDTRYKQLKRLVCGNGLSQEEFSRADEEARKEHAGIQEARETMFLATKFFRSLLRNSPLMI